MPKSKKGDKSKAGKPSGIVSGVGDFIIPKIQDQYSGEFVAIKNKNKIFRHGNGTYETFDGQIYKGKWDMDSLAPHETIDITFKDKSTYKGFTTDMCYDGTGTYTFPNQSFIRCRFSNNIPVDTVTLTDPTGHKWKGAGNPNGLILLQTNVFFENIPDHLGLPGEHGLVGANSCKF